MLDTLLALVDARRGHFRFESGHHSDRWLELDPLFVRPERVRPADERAAHGRRPGGRQEGGEPLVGGAFVAQRVGAALGVDCFYAERVAEPSMGPVLDDTAERGAAPTPAGGGGPHAPRLYHARYALPRALRARVRDQRVAVVDDVVSAGSSVRATAAAVRALGGEVVAVGALLVLGDAARAYFAPHGVPVVGAAHAALRMWEPAVCPLCAAGAPLEDVAAPPAGAPGAPRRAAMHVDGR